MSRRAHSIPEHLRARPLTWIPAFNRIPPTRSGRGTKSVVQRTTYYTGLHPWRNQYFPAPLQWFQDASLIKATRIVGGVTLRFNVDFFNVFNHPNNPTAVAANGVLATQNSGGAARLTQLALRLVW